MTSSTDVQSKSMSNVR